MRGPRMILKKTNHTEHLHPHRITEYNHQSGDILDFGIVTEEP